MQHTYLRYECADSFSLSHHSSSNPHTLSFLPTQSSSNNNSNSSNAPLLLSTASSQIIGYNLRLGSPTLKLSHVDNSSLGSGMALNSDTVCCIDVTQDGKVVTGWEDGMVRVFSTKHCTLSNSSGGSGSSSSGMIRSLLHPNSSSSSNNNTEEEPLTLNGHTTTVSIVKCQKTSHHHDGASSSSGRIASGSTDGIVILWDIVAETGLFRLLGHVGCVTGIEFVGKHTPTTATTTTTTSYNDKKHGDSNDNGNDAQGIGLEDGLITSGTDGLVKIWDLKAQCCIQTLVGHRGSVTCLSLGDCLGSSNNDNRLMRLRLVTGCVDGQVRVWKRAEGASPSTITATKTKDSKKEEEEKIDATKEKDDVISKTEEIFTYIGSISSPSNLSTLSNSEGISSIQFHPRGTYLGISRSNDRVIEIYTPRSEVEVQKKRKRRLQRRREKMNAASNKMEESGGGGGVGIDNNKNKRGILDDPSDEENDNAEDDTKGGGGLIIQDHEAIKAMDEFEFRGTIRSSHKIRAFAFVPTAERGGGIRIAVALATNAFEIYSLPGFASKTGNPVTAEKVSTLDMYGHPTGIRSVALSSEDSLACTVSKNVVKVWNVANRSCLRSLMVMGNTPSKTSSYYCLCVAFLPGNTHIILGTREGHLLIMDVASGDLVYTEENAHEGAIWSLDLRPPGPNSEMSLVTGSADKQVKYWDIESQEDENDSSARQGHPMVTHARTLQMADDVMCVRFSHCTDPSKRLVFVASLDSTIKVFFDDSLKFFLSLYGHKLPVLAFDCSDDDTILASGGADKSIKIWGLDFGDTHRTLYGHGDSITDLRFVKRTHNFFTCSKDKTLRYWDGDRFEQILLLNGHVSEVCCLAMSRTGAFVLSGGMDRQVRVWERTKDIVFLDEEKERRLEEMFDKVDNKEENTADVLMTARKNALNEDDDEEEVDKPQSEAAVKQSILSVSAGDRIMEAIEMADKESKEIAQFKKLKDEKSNVTNRAPNPMMFGMDPSGYVLWVLRSVKSVDLEASLLVLSLNHVERLMHYLILLLRAGRGTELCAKIAVFLVKAHQAQIVSNRTMMTPLRELQILVRSRTTEIRDTVGFNMAAMKAISRIASEKRQANRISEPTNIWGTSLGL